MNSNIQVTFSYKKQFIHVFYSQAKLALCQKLTHVHLFKFILKCTIINAIIPVLEIAPFFLNSSKCLVLVNFFFKEHFIENLEFICWTYCIKLPISFCLQRRGPGNSFIFFHGVVTQDQINSILVKEVHLNLLHVLNTEDDFYFNPTIFVTIILKMKERVILKRESTLEKSNTLPVGTHPQNYS